MGATEPAWTASPFAPDSCQFVTGQAEASLTGEQVLTAGAGITVIGAATTITVASTNPWTLVPCTADQALQNDSTLNNDAYMTFAYTSGYYAFRIRVQFTATAAGDFKFSPAVYSANMVRCNQCYKHVIPGVAAGTAALFEGVSVASGTSVSMAGTGTTGGYVEIDGAFNVNGAGTFNFQWSQATADNNPGLVLHAGSYLEYRKVS
jgi:hypothetical protein